MLGPVHTTDRLSIEPRAEEHAAALCAALAHESVGRFLGGPEPATVEEMTERIRYVDEADPSEWGERWLNWVVRLRTDGTVIGRVEATVHVAREPVIAEIAYVFGPEWGGRGYATEATAWMLDHLRCDHAVAITYATVAPGNDASVRLLERLGFDPSPLPPGGVDSYDDGDLVFALELR